MTQTQKIGKKIYQCYVGVGSLAMGFVAVAVIFAVIMRYFFNISFTFLEELITLVFTFTTFWGIGCCVIEKEHVLIDFLYIKIPDRIRRWLDVFNYFVTIIVLAILEYHAINWIEVAGKTISNGMKVKYMYIYGVMPLGVAVSMVCVAVKIYSLIKNVDLSYLSAEEE